MAIIDNRGYIVVYDGTNGEEIKEMDKEGTPYKVVIKDGITSIGGTAFLECSSLSSIEIPDSVTTIGDDVFYDCGSLKNISWNGTTYSSVDDFLTAFNKIQ